MESKIIQQGAEAIITLVTKIPNPKKTDLINSSIREGGQGDGGGLIKSAEANFIIKDRIKKSYRIPELDKKIRTRRTKAETKLLTKASQIINCPIPLITPSSKRGRVISRTSLAHDVSEVGSRVGTVHQLKIPYINGKKLSEHLDNFSLKKQKQILKQIGEDVAKLHKQNIIHGDLTTSNMILVEQSTTQKPTSKKSSLLINPKSIASSSEPIIFFIDFGLGFFNGKYEDKAVDIHLLKQALEARHFKHWKELFKEFERGYNKSKNSKIVFERLKVVEKRGRYKH